MVDESKNGHVFMYSCIFLYRYGLLINPAEWVTISLQMGRLPVILLIICCKLSLTLSTTNWIFYDKHYITKYCVDWCSIAIICLNYMYFIVTDTHVIVLNVHVHVLLIKV